ncbi:MAG: hypothetical protein A2V63_08660 [Candidatus Eisenbacteria bacterium RBG_19FT_COMBO_70_11]|nr:MAG: hypothetical protein A2V63_08660 [Candidatus Eisenbacteria bacterium RBG_19FT_COMBO_70_11]
MTTGTSLTRRDFLKLGALAGAGLVIAFRIPDAAEAATGAFEPNAWLAIDPQGRITVWIARSEMGQGVRTSLPMLVAEELEADWSSIRFEQAIPAPRYGNMSTGGSQSIRSMTEPLRKAGAAAREMLISAAADTWKVDRATCHAENGAVIHAPSGRKLAYGALAVKAGTLPVPENPPLKDAKDFKILGTRRARLDVPAKVDGSAQFGLDVRVPGMLYAMVERCPVFGGKVASVDAALAEAVKGVRRVLQIGSGVAIVADTLWAARDGRDALRVTWNEGLLASLDSAGIRSTFAELAKKPGASARKEGQGATALAGAARTIEAVYEAPYLAHATMEPMNCTAFVKQDGCEVWVGSQSATGAQRKAAEVSGFPLEKVVVHTMLLGGGFGRRSHQDFVAEAVEISKALNAPVKVVWTREDDMQHDHYRPASYHVLRAGLDVKGVPVAWTHRQVGAGILALIAPQAVQNGLDPTSVDGAENIPYAIPNIEVDYILHDPGVPVWWWRSVGSSHNAFVVECFFDEVAAAAGRDPLELRRELPQGQPRHLAVMELAAAKAGWGKPLPKGRGRGIAVHASFDSYAAQVAEVAVADDGTVRVHRVVCAVDPGHVVNPDTIEAQMESGIVYGLTAALKGEITIAKGRVQQGNFDDYEVLRMNECPAIEVHVAPSGEFLGGIGEVGTPPIAPAVVNAIAAATGKRVRRLPIRAEALRRG